MEASGVAGGIEVRPLDDQTLPAFLSLFDGDAFSDNPHWAGCYCMFYETPGDDWDAGATGAAEHRAARIDLVRKGRARGFVAYADGKAVGWLNAGPRDRYANLRGFAEVDDGTGKVGLLMCFVVAPSHRGRGVATALLDAACEAFRAEGLQYAEGYPPIVPPQKQPFEMPWPAHNYHGPLAMYEKAGFERVRDAGRYAVMRKRL
ncbi:MAG: N-acetyltransferase family protein [Candidatus Limnocylindria bacterium]